jgi:hypothetical protein
MLRKTKKSSSGSIGLMAVGVMLIVGAIAWYIFMMPEQQPQPVRGQSANTNQATPVVDENFSNIERISPKDAKDAHEQGIAVLVDVRTADEYAQGHIAGAMLIPLMDLPTRIGELDPNTWIITY